MSGGRPSGPKGMVDGAGTGEAEPRPMAFARSHSEGLGLDGGRGRRPQKEGKDQPVRAGDL